jgi:hypothetical protein
MLPGVITPVPLANTPVKVALCPAVIVAGLATKLAIVGNGFTVTVVVAVTADPLVGVTVSVYVVVAVGVTVTAVPLVAATFPGVIIPVPLANTPVRVVLCPTVMVAALAVKLVMDAAGGGVVFDEPPQPMKPVRTTPRVITHIAETKDRLIIFPATRNLVVFPPPIIGPDHEFGKSIFSSSPKITAWAGHSRFPPRPPSWESAHAGRHPQSSASRR